MLPFLATQSDPVEITAPGLYECWTGPNEYDNFVV